jgi:hypothetical protein
VKPLATLEDVAAKSKAAADPTNLALVNALDYASGLVRHYTGQIFELVVDDVHLLSGTGTHHLQLPQTPVVDLDAASITMSDWYGNVVTPSTYFLTRLDPVAGILHRIDSTWPIGDLNIAVTYSHGYVMPGETYEGPLTVPPLPGLVRVTTASIAASLYALDPTGKIAAEAIGSYNYSVESGSAEGATWEYALKPLSVYRVVDAA